MKKIVLCSIVFIFSGCVSAKSFRVVESRFARMEKAHKAATVILLATYKKAKFQGEVTLELAKSMNFLFTQNKWLHDKIFMLSAGVEQDNKDLADLDEKVEKLYKKIQRLSGKLAKLEKLSNVSSGEFRRLSAEAIKCRQDIAEIFDSFKIELQEKKESKK